MKVFISGAAGFIGFHCAKRLLQEGHQVLGYDNINDYYDPFYKNLRLEVLQSYDKFDFVKGDLADDKSLRAAWQAFDPSHVLNLGAQAGVRYSIENPAAYVSSNLVGFQNIIDLAKESKVANFVYASSSSVYGGNTQLPFSEDQRVDNPISLYAATKRSNELVAKAYFNLYQLPSTGLRFFTVYGPYGRPDMAMFLFAKAICEGQYVPIFGEGKMARDFTYVDDIVDGTLRALHKPESAEVYNLGRGKREELLDMLNIIETRIGKKAKIKMLPMQAGDVRETIASVDKARQSLGYNPSTTIVDGIPQFVDWFLSVEENRSK